MTNLTNQPPSSLPVRKQPADQTIQLERVRPPDQPTPPGRTPAPAGRSPRRLFWVGFLTSFLLLSVVSCGGLVLSTGLNRLDLADLQGNGASAWTPPIVTPTATPMPDSSGANTNQPSSGMFAIDQQVRNITSSRVNVRQTPGHLGKTDSDILAQMQAGDTVTIVGGPTSTDNLVWWMIQYTASDGRAIEGWTAEATGSGVQILGQ